ncbi:MAG: hypothetical protein E7158_04090 [Firmicutes bacterium]|nr:hypothetical protein [Bacillota bacterium]
MFENKRCYDKEYMKENYPEAVETNYSQMDYQMGMGQMMCPKVDCTNMCPPVMECPKERCCHRYICYEVPHIVPCNTRIINHHIYRHNYIPQYTSCEENEYSNVYGPKCC